jgi:hydrogenase maturation protein HypF
LLDVCHDVSYEAQAAIELEMAVDPDEETAYAFDIREKDQEVVIDPVPVIEAVVSDLRFALPISTIAARFHNAIAEMVRDVCVGIRCQNGVSDVVLSGGVFQNTTLLARALPRLVEAGFTVHTHRLVPPNDACIALGQAVIAGFWAMDRAERAAME